MGRWLMVSRQGITISAGSFRHYSNTLRVAEARREFAVR
jgi:hypothetical protein